MDVVFFHPSDKVQSNRFFVVFNFFSSNDTGNCSKTSLFSKQFFLIPSEVNLTEYNRIFVNKEQILTGFSSAAPVSHAQQKYKIFTCNQEKTFQSPVIFFEL